MITQSEIRNIFAVPPEPPADLLISDPLSSVYISKAYYSRVPVFWDPRRLLNPHIGVFGSTGSGKSYFTKVFTQRLLNGLGVPSIFLDWAGEYTPWIKNRGLLIDFTQNSINLLDPAGQTPLERIRQFSSAVAVAGGLPAYHQAYLEKTLETMFEEEGLDLHKPAAGINFGLKDLEKRLEDGPPELLLTLRRWSGLPYFSGTFDLQKLFGEEMVSVDLSGLPSDDVRTLIGLTLVQLIKERMRREGVAQGLKRLVVLEEAWKIAADERSDVVTIVREGRKYGFGLAIVTQTPRDIHSSLLANLGTAVVFQLPHRADREILAKNLQWSAEVSNRVGKLGVGEFFLHFQFAQFGRASSSFLMNPVQLDTVGITIRVENMDINKQELYERLIELGLPSEAVAKVRSQLDPISSIDIKSLADVLKGAGLMRSHILDLFFYFGLSPKEMAKAMEEDGREELWPKE